MDFTKLKNNQKKFKEESYQIDEDTAFNQIDMFVSFYAIDLSFELNGILDEEEQKELSQMSKDEKRGGVGLKTIIKDLEHWIRLGILSIEKENGKPFVRHFLADPIGEKSEKSEQITEIIYQTVKPKHTEKMATFSADDYTMTQQAEYLMAFLSENTIDIINKYGVKDKRAARVVGMLLLIAL